MGCNSNTSRLNERLLTPFAAEQDIADDVAVPTYEELTLHELDAAAESSNLDERRTHLNQAGVFAALAEEIRGFALQGKNQSRDR